MGNEKRVVNAEGGGVFYLVVNIVNKSVLTTQLCEKKKQNVISCTGVGEPSNGYKVVERACVLRVPTIQLLESSL